MIFAATIFSSLVFLRVVYQEDSFTRMEPIGDSEHNATFNAATNLEIVDLRTERCAEHSNEASWTIYLRYLAATLELIMTVWIIVNTHLQQLNISMRRGQSRTCAACLG